MNYDYNEINKEVNNNFPYGIRGINTFQRSDILNIHISSITHEKDKYTSERRPYVGIKLRSGDYFYAYFENNEQLSEAMKNINNSICGQKLVIIEAGGNNPRDRRIRRDYITEVGTTLYYEALKEI